MREHRIHAYSCYCIDCGAGLDDIVNGKRTEECPATNNVIGISHLVRTPRLMILIDDIFGKH